MSKNSKEMTTKEFIAMSSRVSWRVLAFMLDKGRVGFSSSGKADVNFKDAPAENQFTADEIRFCKHLEHLNGEEIAHFFGITPQAVSQWEDCPKNFDGSFNHKAVFAWRVLKANGIDYKKI